MPRKILIDWDDPAARRAVLAVVRAADAVFHPEDLRGSALDKWKRLERALSRLDRLSNPPQRGGKAKR